MKNAILCTYYWCSFLVPGLSSNQTFTNWLPCLQWIAPMTQGVIVTKWHTTLETASVPDKQSLLKEADEQSLLKEGEASFTAA